LKQLLQRNWREKKTAGDSEYDREVEEYIQNKVSEIEKRRKEARKLPRGNKLDSILLNQRITKSSRNGSIISRIMEGFNFAILGNGVYTLASVRRGADVRIGSGRYSLVQACHLDEVVEDVVFAKIKELSVEALREKLKDSEEFARLKSARTDADVICKQKSYHEQDFGFESRDNRGLTVYVDIPEHVLKSPHNYKLYRFNRHKLGIIIGSESRLPKLLAGPHALTEVSGPFYSRRALCMGSYGKSYMDNMKRGRGFAKLLVDARNVILRGYMSGQQPHHVLDDIHFATKKISVEEVKRKQLPITNVDYQPRRRNNDDDW